MSDTPFGTWLTSLGACTPAIPVFAPFTNVSTAYASVAQPDWLLWFCFSQTTDHAEKVRVLGLLQTAMGATLTAAATGDSAALVTTSLADLTAFVGGTLDPVAGKADFKSVLGTVQSLPEDTAPRIAAHCAALLLSLCLAAPGVPSGNIASHLALKWMKLLQLQGTLPNDDTAPGLCATALRTAIPLNNMTPIPT